MSQKVIRLSGVNLFFLCVIPSNTVQKKTVFQKALFQEAHNLVVDHRLKNGTIHRHTRLITNKKEMMIYSDDSMRTLNLGTVTGDDCFEFQRERETHTT